MRHRKPFHFYYMIHIASLLVAAGSILSAHRVNAEIPNAVVDKVVAAKVPFIKNEGQIANKEVLFFARTFAGTLFVTAQDQLVYSLPNRTDEGAPARWVFRESFTGQQQALPQGESRSPVRVSFFKGDQPRAWKRQLPTYESVNLGELYPGITVSLNATGGSVEKLFHVSPGANPADIRIAISGVGPLAVDSNKQLLLTTTRGDIVFTAPIAYQMVNGERQAVEASYILADNHQYGFKLGTYDQTRELIIDPLLASTYLGGHNPNPPGNYDDDMINSMIIAGDDSIYVAGVTQSPDFPIKNGYDDSLANSYPDGFITRMTSDLKEVIASTYIGTVSFDRVEAISLADDGSIVAVGQAGNGFPVTDGAYNWKGSKPTGGGFVAKFSADLSNLVASAVVTPYDYPLAAAVGSDVIYFGGRTHNSALPVTAGAYDSTCGSDGRCNPDGFGITQYFGFAGRISADLSTLQALTYLDDGKRVSGMAVAPDGTVFIADGEDNEITGYLARFNAGLTQRLAFLSYYPGSHSGSSRTYFNAVAVTADSVITAGQTYMNDLPATAGAYDTTCGTDGICNGTGPYLVPVADGFVAKYGYELGSPKALTYLGGSGQDSIRSIALGADGGVYIVGETTSVNFPVTANAVDTSCGTDGRCNPVGKYKNPVADGFAAKLTADLSALEYGSYLGGSGEDRPNAVALNSMGVTYVAGYTRSSNFPTTAGAYDRTYNGGTSDAFISAIDLESGGVTPPAANKPPVAKAGSDQTVAPRQAVVLDGRASSDPDGQIVQYGWRQLSGKTVQLTGAAASISRFSAPAVKSGAAETMVFELEVTDDLGAKATDQIMITVTR